LSEDHSAKNLLSKIVSQPNIERPTKLDKAEPATAKFAKPQEFTSDNKRAAF